MRKIGLFNMDFPDYIKGNTKFIIITCDYSILIFQKTINLCIYNIIINIKFPKKIKKKILKNFK